MRESTKYRNYRAQKESTEKKYRKNMRETRQGNKFWQLTPLFTPDLPGDRHLTLGILEKLKFC